MLTPERIRIAYQNAVPARREEFKRVEYDCLAKASHQNQVQAWYIDRILELAKAELRTRLAMAAQRVRELIDSGWRPDQMNSVKSVYTGMFSLYDHYEKDSFRDLYDYVEGAFERVGYAPQSPYQQDSYVLDLSNAQVRYSEEFTSDLEVYAEAKVSQHEPASVHFHGNPSIGSMQTGQYAVANVTQNVNADLTQLVEAILNFQSAVTGSNEPNSPRIVALAEEAVREAQKPHATASTLSKVIGGAAELIQTAGAVPAAWYLVVSAFAAHGVHLPSLPR